MIDAKMILSVMHDGGSLEEAAAAQDISVEELINYSTEYQDIATALSRGLTLVSAYYSKKLRTGAVSDTVYRTVMLYIVNTKEWINNAKR